MYALGRMILGAFALLLAIPAGLFFATLAATVEPNVGAIAAEAFSRGFFAVWDGLAETGDVTGAAYAFGVLSTVGLALFVAPVALTGLVGEVLGFRAFAYYAGVTGLATAAQPFVARAALKPASEGEMRVALALFLTGATAGAVYWLIAGRSAGRASPPAVSVPRSPGS